VLIVGRQVVGTVTGLAVLLCSIACACGSMAAPSRDADDEQAPAETSCHGHHAESPAHGESKKPDPCKKEGKKEGEDHSCQHCQPNTSPQLGEGKLAVQLTPFAHLVGVLNTAPFDSQQFLLISTPWSIVGDLSPPLAPTLLRLHCALNT
jgi:hypothetical protein